MLFIIHKKSQLSVVFLVKEAIKLAQVYSVETIIMLSMKNAVG